MGKLFLIILATFFLGIGQVQAARLYFEPANLALEVGETAIVNLKLDTEGKCLNLIEASLVYDQKSLVVTDVLTNNSVVSVWLKKPNIKTPNELSLSGGLPNGYCGIPQGDPGESNVVMSLIIKAGVVPTKTNISIKPEAKFFLNNGKGTEYFFGTELLIVDIKEGMHEFNLSSPTHPDQDAWSRSGDVVIEWPSADYDYSVGISDSQAENPDTVSISPELDATGIKQVLRYSNLADGIYFVTVRFKEKKSQVYNDGDRLVYRVMIDRELPKIFDTAIEIINNQTNLLFNGVDKTSGVNKYFLKIGADEYKSVESPVVISANEIGRGLSLRAVDRAGNSYEINNVVDLVQKKKSAQQAQIEIATTPVRENDYLNKYSGIIFDWRFVVALVTISLVSGIIVVRRKI